MFSLFCEYIHLEYVRIHGIYRVDQAEYVIHILVVAPHEYMNIYSTRRTRTCGLTRPQIGLRAPEGVMLTLIIGRDAVGVIGRDAVGRRGAPCLAVYMFI